jgi:CDP-glucose 4,6-dehydratase
MSGGGVQATLAEPIQCLKSTVESTWWLLDILRRRGSPTVMVVCSSDKAYGEQETPYREAQALRPQHPQEVAKASQDLLTQSFGKAYGLNVAVTRCGNFFGPYDFNFTRIIPYVARCCALGEHPQLRSDGRFVRDFLSIQESTTAHLMLAQELSARRELQGEVFNFSYEVQITMSEIVARIMHHANSDLEPVVTNSARNEIRSMGLSCDKARAVLNWKPRLGFEESLAVTTAWYLDWFHKSGPMPKGSSNRSAVTG